LKIAELNKEMQSDPVWASVLQNTDIRVGVGVHTGMASVGNFGSDKRVDYSCVGDTVNSAARIEGMCKEHKAAILLSADAVPDTQRVLGKSVGQVVLRGREKPLELFDFTPKTLAS